MAADPAGAPRETFVEDFSDFYRAHVPRLIAVLVWCGARTADATDVVQDSMIKAYQRWETLKNPGAWCRKVAIRAWLHQQAQRREDPCADPALEPVALQGRADERANPLLRQDEVPELLAGAVVMGLLLRLPDRQRQVLALAVDGYSPTESAEILGIGVEAARASLYKARRTVAIHIRLEEGR